MSVSTDAILLFGIVGDSEDDERFPADVDLYERAEEWAKRHGPSRPESLDCQSPEWSTWRQENALFESTGIGVVCGNYCSDSCPIQYIALQAHHYTAWRGSVVSIDPAKMTPTSEQLVALRQFCDETGVKWETPGWHLVSYWG